MRDKELLYRHIAALGLPIEDGLGMISGRTAAGEFACFPFFSYPLAVGFAGACSVRLITGFFSTTSAVCRHRIMPAVTAGQPRPRAGRGRRQLIVSRYSCTRERPRVGQALACRLLLPSVDQRQAKA